MLGIDSSFFANDEFQIPGVNLNGSSNAAAVSQASSYNLGKLITKKEPEFLKKLLGVDLYNEFSNGLNETGQVQERWSNLKLKIVSFTNKTSPFANYVWYWWSRNRVSSTSTTGENDSLTENSKPVGFAQKQVLIWGYMVDMISDIDEFINENIQDYQSFNPDKNLRKRLNSFNL